MAQRAGSADLPLHGGRVPEWLAGRMARLGAIIAEAICQEYGRDEFLSRLANPFWFQSFGAVMGMDWHSSGITTSVVGALKRGLTPLEKELGLHVCGGRGRHSRKTPDELVAIGNRVGFDGAALAKASRLVAKVDSAAVQDGFELYLHGFIVADDGKWVVVQQGMKDETSTARRYHWQSEGLRSRPAGDDRPGRDRQGGRQTRGATGRGRAGGERGADPAVPGDAGASRRAAKRCDPAAAACVAGRRSGQCAQGFFGAAADAGGGGADGAVAGDGGRGDPRRAAPVLRSGPICDEQGGQGRRAVPGAAQGL